VHPEVATVVALAMHVAAGTGGAYDITVEPLVRLWGFLGGKPHVPEPAEIDRVRGLIGIEQLHLDAAAGAIAFARAGVRIDLGGIAKGYAVDRALERLRGAGVEAGLVDLSGNMAALGAPPHRPSWTVGVRDPRDRIPFFGRVRLDGRAVATSGNYEQFVDAGGQRYGHILDPRTGWPAQGLISATVLAPTAAEADAWDTALIVLGPAAARALATAHPELDVVLVQPASTAATTASGTAAVDTLWIEHTLRASLTLEDAAAPLFCVREF
jgi:thiamine biosynthesis lipoprotein